MRNALSAAALALAISICSLAQAPAMQTRQEQYRLQPGDSVEVQYRFTPEFNAKALIQPDGRISIPIAGAVAIGGLTIAEAQSAIAGKAAARLRDPEVILVLTDFVKPAFTLAGEVAKPGRYDLRGGITAVDAVAIGGGFNRSAKHSQVLLVRRFNDEFADVRVIDLKRIMQFNGIQEDVRLQNGDLLIVPQNAISKVERYVQWGTLYAGFGLWRR